MHMALTLSIIMAEDDTMREKRVLGKKSVGEGSCPSEPACLSRASRLSPGKLEGRAGPPARPAAGLHAAGFPVLGNVCALAEITNHKEENALQA